MSNFCSRQLRTPVLLVTLAVACSPGPENRGSDTTAVATDTSLAAGAHDMAGMAMTGDPDHDFLRMMGSHHKGLITLAHESMLKGSRGTPQSQDDARILDARQDRELEQMIGMLQASYQDSTQPQVTPDDQAMIDSVLGTPGGPAYASAFYRAVVTHHRLAIAMIDQYLPRARRADLKALAEQMRKDHLDEVRQFERKGE